MDTEPRNTPADKRRGDAILTTMQAARAYRDTTAPPDMHPFDEAHHIVGRLVDGGYIHLTIPATEENRP